jgi:hypothetical protein
LISLWHDQITIAGSSHEPRENPAKPAPAA